MQRSQDAEPRKMLGYWTCPPLITLIIIDKKYFLNFIKKWYNHFFSPSNLENYSKEKSQLSDQAELSTTHRS